VQRSINLGGDAIIYGENFLFAEFAPYHLGGDLGDIGHKSRVCDATMDEFMGGNKGMDASSLYPNYKGYRRMTLELFYRMGEFFRDESRKLGYEKWGFKHQIQELPRFHNFVRLIPKLRALTLYRDALDVAKSVRARWPQNLHDERQAFAQGRRWREHLRYLLQMRPSENLVVRYEDLIARREQFVPRIEAHLSVKLAPEAFEKKVNVHGFDAAGGKHLDEYMPPAELPEPMIRAVLAGANPLYEELGYAKRA
jgi:hypothetical protein